MTNLLLLGAIYCIIPTMKSHYLINGLYTEYALWQGELDAQAEWELQNTDLDAWMSEQEKQYIAREVAEMMADADAIHYGAN